MIRMDMEIFGEHYFTSKVDITDPCYDKGTWCRKTVNVVEGNYDLCYTMADEGAWGNRVAKIAIFHKDYSMDIINAKLIGEIGVDAGLAGFFNDKKDYTDAEWSEFCHNIDGKDLIEIDNGFFSSSGYGDGMYDVYAYYNDNNEIVGLEIIFIEEGDEDDWGEEEEGIEEDEDDI